MEHAVPNPASDSVAVFRPARTMMAKVISLETPEEAIAKLSEMHEIAGPRFANTALHNPGEESG